MIAVYDFLWLRLADYAAKYQSGTDVVSAFNSKLSEVQVETFNNLVPFYEVSEKVKTLLDVWVKEQVGSSDSTGFVTAGIGDEVVNRPISIGYTSGGSIIFSIVEIGETELIAIARMPQRQPNVAKKNVYYRFNSPSTLQFYPKAITPYDMFYFIYPSEAHIAFTFTSTADEDIMTYDPTDSIDLAWPSSASNLILYGMLQKYGVSVRESLLQEYSKYGIDMSATLGEVKR